MSRTYSWRSRWWIALLQVVLLLATVVAPAAAAAGPAPLSGAELVQLLQSYGIVKGDETGNLNLDKPITRAEMITIMVRARGGERHVDMYKGIPIFKDTRGEWFEGYINYASNQELVKGDGNGYVRPKDNITYGEALTLIERLAGREPTTGEWPLNVLMTAVDLGIVPANVNAGNIRQYAIRGLVFQSLATGITTIKLQSGKTILQTYIATVPPVLNVTTVPTNTTQAQIQLSGTAKDAVRVTVNDNPAALIGQSFSASVALEYGENTINVIAEDRAGNQASQQVKVTRVAAISKLEITGASQVRRGATVTYQVLAYDQNNNRTSSLSGVTASVEGNIGSFNLQTGTFTASNTPGKGKITVTAGAISKSLNVEVMGQDTNAARLNIRQINNGRAISYTKPMTVSVEVQDTNGKFLDGDYGRPVTLTPSGLSGLTVSPAVAYTDGGVATFTITGTSTGFINLQATSSDLVGSFATGEFGSNLRVRLAATPTSLSIGTTNTTSRIVALLVDENGSAVTNQTGTDIYVTVAASGTDGTMTDPYLHIMRGASTSTQSGDDALFSAGAQPGTVTITGTVTSGQRVTVDSASIGATLPNIGGGSKWDLITYQPYSPHVQGTFYVRLTDAVNNTIPGSHAFQLSLTTSNNEPKTNGIPEGVTVTLGTTGLNPVNDGIAEGGTNDGSDVIARTVAGTAFLKITYNKPGQVFVTVEPATGTTTAYAQDGSVGTAINPGVQAQSFTLNFTQTPTAVKLLADSDGLGNGYRAGATAPGHSFTLHAYLTDSQGTWIPATSSLVTLAKVSGTATNPTSALTATAINGKADFTVNATGAIGEDVYKVTTTIGNMTYENTATLQVQNTLSLAPSIIAVRGTNNGIAGALNYVAPDDTGMEIELSGDGSQHWAVVRVYVENGNLIYTSAPVELNTGSPRVTVPKSALPNGVYRYQISVRNGYSESTRSIASNQVTNSLFANSFSLSGVKYQRSTKILTIYGSGFSNNNDTINPALITIRDTSTGQRINLAGAQVTVTNYNTLTLNLTGLTTLINALEDPAKFSGSDVTLTTAAGWYTRSNGEQSVALTPGAVVGPMANIRDVMYDRVNSRLYLNGEGFNNVTLNMANLKLAAAGAQDIALHQFSSARVNDNLWQINLNANTMTALDANGNYALYGLDGWTYDSTWVQPAFPVAPGAPGLPIYAQLSLASVTYSRSLHTLTLRGSGFTGGSATIGSLTLTDKDTNQVVTLSGTSTIMSDGQIHFVLDPTAIAIFEDTTKFRTADSIYLTGTAGWFTNANARPAASIPDRTLRLSLQ